MKYLFIAVFLFCCRVAFCQTPGISNNIWANSGPGIYVDGPYRGIKCMGSIDEDNYGNFTEAGLLYGKSFGKVVQLTLAGGLGIVSGIKTEGYNPPGTPRYGEKDFFVPGIPLEVGLNLVPSKYFGFGLVAFADINSRCTFYGFGLDLSIGKIK